MKTKPFLLGAVLRLYAAREEHTRIALANAMRGREFMEQALAAATATLENDASAYAEYRQMGNFAAGSHNRHWAALLDGQANCDGLKARLETARKEEAQAREVMREARRKHEMMIKLHGRHAESQRLETIRGEEEEMADFYNASRLRQLREMPEACATFV